MEDKLHLAPIGPNPQNVLDVATGQKLYHMSASEFILTLDLGTGIWAIEFGECRNLSHCRTSDHILAAQQYPSARVLGTDLSAIQPLL